MTATTQCNRLSIVTIRLIFISLFVLLLLPGVVSAQNSSPIPTHQTQLQLVGEDHKRKVEQRHGQIQEHLKQVKNKHHAQVAEKVHKNLNHVNGTLTTAWSHHLSKMSEILVKLEEHLNQAASEDKDVTDARNTLADAKQAVTEAENVLKTQADKTYTFNITNPEHIGSDVQGARDLLHSDLKSVHDALNNAREAVVEATKVVNQTVGGNHGN